ncbi:MAG: hypothetical protein ACQESF_04585 [Nanobdellota archaeon]
MPHGEHHIHQRKRIHKDKQEFPHPNSKVRFIDTLAMINSIAMPLTTLPQIFKIYFFKMATGVSLSMWVLYNISCVVMLIYGIVHKAKAIIVLNIMWLLVNFIIIIGVIIYG